jgi:hypothetical protein
MKMDLLPRVICMFNAIPLRIPMSFITEIEKNQPKSSFGSTKDHK